jgi:hypothetical protein
MFRVGSPSSLSVYTLCFLFFGIVGLCVPGLVLTCLGGGRLLGGLGLGFDGPVVELFELPFTLADFVEPFPPFGGLGAISQRPQRLLAGRS